MIQAVNYNFRMNSFKNFNKQNTACNNAKPATINSRPVSFGIFVEPNFVEKFALRTIESIKRNESSLPLDRIEAVHVAEFIRDSILKQKDDMTNLLFDCAQNKPEVFSNFDKIVIDKFRFGRSDYETAYSMKNLFEMERKLKETRNIKWKGIFTPIIDIINPKYLTKLKFNSSYSKIRDPLSAVIECFNVLPGVAPQRVYQGRVEYDDACFVVAIEHFYPRLKGYEITKPEYISERASKL